MRVDKVPLVDSEVAKHVQRVEDPSLITVTHTPNAITTHLVASETAERPTVRMEQGRVVTKVVTVDYGTIVSVVGGPAVVEIALHERQEQREAYLRAIAAVDAESAEHAVVALREAVLAFVQTVGVVDGDTSNDGEAAT